jgi:anti-sigma B factor antagonist
VVIQLAGKITLGPECQQIEWLIADLLSQGEARIVFDLSGVELIDSTGLGIIVFCAGKVKEAGGELRVAGARGDVEHLLKMTHVDHIIALYPNTAAALKGFVRSAA